MSGRPPRRPSPRPPRPRRGPAPLSPEDRALFRRAVGPVRPLRQERVALRPPPPPPRPRELERDEASVLEELRRGAWDPAEVESGEELLYARPGLQRTVLRRLRRGRYRVGAELDLHGLSVGAAFTALAAFLARQRRAGVLCVRVIHGKGLHSVGREPVLRRRIGPWLRRREEVLAYCEARPADGGAGALYVLLRRLR